MIDALVVMKSSCIITKYARKTFEYISPSVYVQYFMIDALVVMAKQLYYNKICSKNIQIYLFKYIIVYILKFMM